MQRIFLQVMMACFLLSALAVAQENTAPPPEEIAHSHPLMIPAGTEVPVALKHAISTKTAREGDPVYAQTTFPIVQNGRMLVPAGTYVQGRISRTKRAGRVKGRAEVLIHFTTLIYPNGYTILLPGAVENVPGAENASVKGTEGTIQQDRQTGQKIEKAAGTTATGAIIGGLSNGGKGAGIGAGVGGAVGVAIAMLSRGSDVRLGAGDTVQMVIQRDVLLDANRISAKSNALQ